MEVRNINNGKKIKLLKNPFVIGFFISLLFILFSSLFHVKSSSALALGFVFFLIPYTIIGAMAVMLCGYINKKQFFVRLKNFQITFVVSVFILILLIVGLFHYNLLLPIYEKMGESFYSFGSFAFNLLKYFVIGLFGDGLVYLISMKNKKNALRLKRGFIIFIIFLLLKYCFDMILAILAIRGINF